MSHPLEYNYGVMNNKHTEIAFILDRSGSMQPLMESAISGFNDLLRDQTKAPDEARFTLVLFDDQYEVPMHAIPIAEAVELDTSTYVPRGSTALLDAVGRTIDELGSRLAAMSKKDRPGKVIVAILTDGLENASQKYTWQDISTKISHQRDTYQWEFLFLGANQDAIATAAEMSIESASAMTYVHDSHGTKSSQRALSRKFTAMRTSGKKDAMSEDVRADLEAPLSKIGEEEDRKSRGEGRGE